MVRRQIGPEERAALAHVGERIRAARKAAGLTQEQLAEASDLHATFISRVEGGKVNPSLGSLLSIARATSTTVADLVEGIE